MCVSDCVCRKRPRGSDRGAAGYGGGFHHAGGDLCACGMAGRFEEGGSADRVGDQGTDSGDR